MPVTPCSSCGGIPSFKPCKEEGVSEYSCKMSEPTCVALRGNNLMMLAHRWEKMYYREHKPMEVVQYADGFEAMDDFKRRGLLPR